MLNYPNAERFFDNCLIEAGVSYSWSSNPTLQGIQADPGLRQALLKALRDIQNGADAVLQRGKPAEDTLNLTTQDWEHRWAVWAGSRTAAFFSRAAMLMLGQVEYKPYFIQTLHNSHNLVFLGGASDVLQHSSGHYLTGPLEDMTNAQMAEWWENHQG